MTQLHNINVQTIATIRDGLNSLSESLLTLNSIVGDSSSRLVVDGDGNLKVQSSATTLFEGKIGVGVSNVSQGVDIETANSVKFQGKKFEVGDGIPTIGLYNRGDIVWNDSPKANGHVGWICIRTGTPGEWRAFGAIGG